MTGAPDLWAILPVKELDTAKQRLSALLPPVQRRLLAQAMVEDVLDAIRATRGLAGILVVTADATVAAIARGLGARVTEEDARSGYTGSVTAAVRLLAREKRTGMITLPGDIPAAKSTEIEAVLAAHGAAPAFTIAPAHDGLGTNAIACSPPDAVPLGFGENSFARHVATARRLGISPAIIERPGLGLDIDHPPDIVAFLRLPQSAGTRTRAMLEAADITRLLSDHGAD